MRGTFASLFQGSCALLFLSKVASEIPKGRRVSPFALQCRLWHSLYPRWRPLSVVYVCPSSLKYPDGGLTDTCVRPNVASRPRQASGHREQNTSALPRWPGSNRSQSLAASKAQGPLSTKRSPPVRTSRPLESINDRRFHPTLACRAHPTRRLLGPTPVCRLLRCSRGRQPIPRQGSATLLRKPCPTPSSLAAHPTCSRSPCLAVPLQGILCTLGSLLSCRGFSPLWSSDCLLVSRLLLTSLPGQCPLTTLCAS